MGCVTSFLILAHVLSPLSGVLCAMRTFSDKTRKLIIASITAPIAIVPALFIPLVIHDVVNSLFNLGQSIYYSMLAAIPGWVVAQVLTLVFGLPLVIFLQRSNKFRLVYLLPISAIPALLFFSISGFGLTITLMYIYFSVCVAYTFWFTYWRVSNGT